MVENRGAISRMRQCELLGINRSGLYYTPAQAAPENLRLMHRIDRIYTAKPFYGYRRVAHVLRQEGHEVNHKRVQRLMQLMGLQALYPKPRTTIAAPGHKIYPYLLRDLRVERPDHVWSTDITYIPMRQGFLYLVAIIDWISRCVLAWELSNTMDVGFCITTLTKALAAAKPDIFNSDQGAQFTALDFTRRLLEAGVHVSMDGRGRALDNVFIERLWRSVKYEEVYLHEYIDGTNVRKRLGKYFDFYNWERPHQSLGDKTPGQVYRER
jgi:putative transposase